MNKNNKIEKKLRRMGEDMRRDWGGMRRKWGGDTTLFWGRGRRGEEGCGRSEEGVRRGCEGFSENANSKKVILENQWFLENLCEIIDKIIGKTPIWFDVGKKNINDHFRIKHDWGGSKEGVRREWGGARRARRSEKGPRLNFGACNYII